MCQSFQDRLQKAERVISETKSLRKLQKEYFKTRDYEILNQAKIQERKVDDMIKNYDNPQPKLW
jgi:hypothetical protein